MTELNRRIARRRFSRTERSTLGRIHIAVQAEFCGCQDNEERSSESSELKI